MYCPECKHVNSPEAQFCPACGAALAHPRSRTRTPADDRRFFEDDFIDGPLHAPMPRQSRIAGTALALTTAGLLVTTVGYFIGAIQHGTDGAEAGAIVLLALVAWCGYLSLPEDRQHDSIMDAWNRFSARIDGRLTGVESSIRTRRELRWRHDQANVARRERDRRVHQLGEAALRLHRLGELGTALSEHVARVDRVEQTMLGREQALKDMLSGAIAEPERRPDHVTRSS